MGSSARSNCDTFFFLCFPSEDRGQVDQNMFSFTGCLLTGDMKCLGFVEMRMFGFINVRDLVLSYPRRANTFLQFLYLLTHHESQ
jgi:hypothetical protein